LQKLGKGTAVIVAGKKVPEACSRTWLAGRDWPIYTILERGTSADEQLQVWRDTGDIKAVVDRLIAMTLENVPGK
jgi:hypothetical protein